MTVYILYYVKNQTEGQGIYYMIYKKFRGENISALALGGMRLPTRGDDADIDEGKTAEMVAYAIENGVNYFDTAWGYHGGNSELVMGRVLSEYPRASFKLATKFPGYDLSNMDKVGEIFEKQLEKCRVEYFDFYLFHNVCERNIEQYLDPSYGIYDYLMKQKKLGRIRHLGFSAHGSVETIRRFLDAYGKDMEFCQIQLNYLDWTLQNGKEKVELLKERNIPVWVMEPVRGGKLAAVSEPFMSELRAIRPEETAASWAFRFLQSIPEVVTVLSGMSDMSQLKENMETFSTEKPLDDSELDALLGIADRMIRPNTLPCTACRYCTPHCPQGLDIPLLLSLYNEHSFSGGGFIAPMQMSVIPEDKRPSACIGCRSCEAVCPQQIKISEAMTDFVKILR